MVRSFSCLHYLICLSQHYTWPGVNSLYLWMFCFGVKLLGISCEVSTTHACMPALEPSALCFQICQQSFHHYYLLMLLVSSLMGTRIFFCWPAGNILVIHIITQTCVAVTTSQLQSILSTLQSSIYHWGKKYMISLSCSLSQVIMHSTVSSLYCMFCHNNIHG